MILYISSATSYKIYDEMFEKNVVSAYQAQKFNYTLIKGISEHERIVSIASMPYVSYDAPEIYENVEGVDFYCAKNRRGLLHKITKITEIVKLTERVIKKEKPRLIICDAIVVPASIAAIKMGRKYKIPTLGIITDIPEIMEGKKSITSKITYSYMTKYDMYVLMTEQMNQLINPNNKPYIVMEGVCSPVKDIRVRRNDKRIVMYTGALWKNDAGLEYFTEGFIKAQIPNCELHFYGTGEWVNDLVEITRSYPNIRYMGCLKNSEIIERQMEATLLVNPRPSTQEFTKYSFPSKTFEYMSSGTPTLMTRLPGVLPEYFNYVYTIDTETSDGVASKLREILNKPQAELESFAKKAKQFVDKNKNASVQTQKILNFASKISLD